ncbi:14546_t:CDS:1, partial [Cetraspora pellucida]
EDVDTIMKAYGIKHGFTIIKKQLSYHENGSIKHHSFGCEFGGHYQPKKQINVDDHRDHKSKRQQCEWHVNINCPKNFQQITITTFNNIHNHSLFPDTKKYSSQYRCIPDDILKEVQFFTEHGNLSITTQQRLLKA